MDPLISVALFLSVVLLCMSPAVVQWADSKDKQDALPAVMTGRETLARHLYGEFHGWDRSAMVKFDGRTVVREPWLERADTALAEAYGRE